MFTLLSDQVKKFLSNPVLLACISSWFCAQFIKTVISILYGRIHSLYELVENLIWKTGGLPSSHSALVASLSTTVGFRNGISSDIFILSLCFFMVTIRDAVGVRRSNGIQAQKINEIGRLLNKKDIIDYKPIREVNGHTPMEVTIGCLLGFFIGLAFSLF
ncbi:MAG: divergent PAP2 family protein [Treponema porcinum]|uniref:Divergent PAP2 family protein n=1 Tax=Treponema porcinum TaxID=261392 RepID=A0A1T4JT18_TREPO|nr:MULTISPECIES: divergent PAP2 family protein [Treponema]MCI5644285.1 divergent PAP2 family protein [Treponema porcinum]MCI6180227.1 divergent PAP2 family protein [Treponema porcinum]MCI6321987.1 divergent PAP2 family protein [Treponema porcinum]MCI6482190.1 divergent PAP2 family protein [Treponema porcinum]MCI6722424.1 divergent PAP2 family protein [Treponema porcinum]